VHRESNTYVKLYLKDEYLRTGWSRGRDAYAEKFPLGEKIEEHAGVGLLGQLVAIGRVAFGLENAVHSVDQTVLPPVGRPIQILLRAENREVSSKNVGQ
jgi:hypothetical protein